MHMEQHAQTFMIKMKISVIIMTRMNSKHLDCAALAEEVIGPTEMTTLKD